MKPSRKELKSMTVEQLQELFNQLAYRYGVVHYEIDLKTKEAKHIEQEMERVSIRAASLKAPVTPSLDEVMEGTSGEEDEQDLTPEEHQDVIQAQETTQAQA